MPSTRAASAPAAPSRWQPGDRWFAGLAVTLAMVVAVVLVDVLLMALAGDGLGERNAAILAAVVVTLAVAPFHDRLTAVAHRLLTRRDDTFEVVSALADRLADAPDEGGRLGDLVSVVAEGFGARYVEVRLTRRDGAAAAARHGEPVEDALRIPIEYRDALLGELLVAPDRRLSRRDRVLLADLVRLAAAALVTAERSDELQRIRTRLVLAREDERQRLRADLNDHLVPMLETLSAGAGAARQALEWPSSPAPREHLSDAVSVASAAVDDIRRVAQHLRPPALDDLGLAKALDQLAARYAERIPGLALRSDLPGERPAAVEVAVYRIVADALETIARRMTPAEAEVAVAVDGGTLRVDLRVTGAGGLAGGRAGEELDAQRERAEELGGSWRVEEHDGVATISAVLPVTTEAAGVR